MPNWSETMQQTFEYYIVDPNTWRDKKRIENVISSTINRDSEAQTLGSLTIDIAEPLGECYVRVYLITIQNGIQEKHPLGTYIIQTPSRSFDGMVHSVSMDAYTPLLELKEKQPPLGYSLLEETKIMEQAYLILRENMRAPISRIVNEEHLYFDFVANTDDTWLSFTYDLIANAKYTLAMDELGNILFQPIQNTAALQPIWYFNDDNSSILHPKIEVKHDLYGVPNVVEVIYSNGLEYHYAKVKNEDPDSPISTVSRGREIIYRETNPTAMGNPTGEQITAYANQLLRNLSTLEYRATFTHAYCPVRLNDCVMINYTRANIKNVKAKVISQSIKCEPGCPVTTTVVFTNKLWG